MTTVFIINGDRAYTKMFAEKGYAVISDMKQADMFCFTGGEDVTPALYGEEKHPYTFNSTNRDAAEKEYFHYAVEHDIPCVGICRGGQFLNVMNGGKMYQHVLAHTRYHQAVDVATGKELLVSSTHHQMMRPAEVGAEVVTIAHQNESKEWMEDGKICVCFEDPDTEAVWYAQTRCLCFQPHPEFDGIEDCTNYFFELIDRYIS